MTIIDKMEVAMVIDGERVNEYDDEELSLADDASSPDTVSKYIEAIPGREFAINLKVHESYLLDPAANCVRWLTYIDGNLVSNIIMKDTSYRQRGFWELTVDCKLTHGRDGSTKSKFQFRELNITHDDPSGHRKSIEKQFISLGTIEVRVAQGFYQVEPIIHPRQEEPLAIVESVPEKALKGRAITVGASFGQPRWLPSPTIYAIRPVGREPLATFRFLYRTKKSLQDLLVIPREEPNQLEEDVDNMTAEELRVLLRQERAKRNFVHIKDEDSDDLAVEKDSTRHDCKAQQSNKRAKLGKEANVTVIEIDSD